MIKIVWIPMAFLIPIFASTAPAALGLDRPGDGRRVTTDVDLPPGFYVENAAPGTTFANPVGVACAPDGRIFVAQKGGQVFIIENGVALPTPFIDLESEVLDHWDRGLLGIELDPDFANNGHIYFLYTVDQDGSGDYSRFDVFGRLVRYTADAGDPNLADLASRLVLLGATFSEGIPACYYSHAPGSLRFGADGTLLASAGDAASFNQVDPGGLYPACFGPNRIDPYEDIGAFRSQYLGSLAGKILRLDPATGLGLPSNPFYTGDPSDVASKVWVRGLRNPFRFGVRPGGSTDPADGQPGALFIGDVGWNQWEDENVGKTGAENFGWPCFEGPNAHGGYQNASPAHDDCATAGVHTPPQFYWSHSNASASLPPGLRANAIVGGEFYLGSTYPPGYVGRVFYGDYTRHWLASATVDASDNLVAQEVFSPDLGSIVDLRYDPVSESMLYVDLVAGTVMRIRYADGDNPPVAIAAAVPTEGYAPLAVQFTGSDSYDPFGEPLDFDWDFGDGGGSSEADPLHTYTSDGLYAAMLTVTDPAAASASFPLTISVGNTSPTAQIASPADGVEVAVGQVVDLLGTAVDTDEPESALTFAWEVFQRHNDHGHPPFFTATGPAAQFTVLAHGLPEEVNFLEIVLTATDTGGLSDAVTHRLWITADDESDITADGSPIALVTAPSGAGNPDIEVIRDGVQPPAGSNDPLLQYDTYDGQPKSEDWIGYEFPDLRYFSRLLYQDGVHGAGGGWFDSLRVEVRRDDVWQGVDYLNAVPLYPGADGVNFGAYVLLFHAALGDAVRLVGDPGGADDFISVGELRAYAIPSGAPVVVQPGDQTSAEGEVIALQISATDPDEDILTYGATGLPNDLALAPDTGLIAGTLACDAADSSPYLVTVAVDDGFNPPVEVAFNWTVTAAPPAIGDLAAVQVLHGNDGDGTTGVTLNWTPVAAGFTVAVYRQGYGNYPEYDDDAPAGVGVPDTPATPAAALADGWELTAVANPGEVDETTTRDFWYYVAFVASVCDVSGPSNQTGGALNYHLGDVAGGPGDAGDNVIDIAHDVQALALAYGLTAADPGWVAAVDVGPTTTGSPLARPLTDDQVEFEDLIIVAVNFDSVGKYEPPAAAARNLLTLRVREDQAPPSNLRADLWLEGDGTLQGLSVRLAWNESAMVPLGFERGDLLDAQGGQNLVLSPAPGSVDATLFGRRDAGISGRGLLASFTFQRTTTDDPELSFADLRARDVENRSVELETTVQAATAVLPDLPTVTRLHPASPNPFNPQTRIAFDLARGGSVRAGVYSVDGRLVQLIVDAELPAGRHSATWHGRDASGRAVPSGLYFVRLVTRDVTEIGRMTLVR